MVQTVSFKVEASDEGGAPRLEDLLDQARDFLEMLRDVERAAKPYESSAIEWRVVSASKNSPLELKLQARQHDERPIEQLVREVVERTDRGWRDVLRGNPTPPTLPRAAAARAASMLRRVTGGLGLTAMTLVPERGEIRVNASTAQPALDAGHEPRPHSRRELGMIEGTLTIVDKLRSRPAFTVVDAVSGEPVRCLAESDDLLRTFAATTTVREVWEGRRVRVTGLLIYRGKELREIRATGVEWVKPSRLVQRAGDLTDPSFTGGVSAVEYLARLREGELG